jgi:hypothetical protein
LEVVEMSRYLVIAHQTATSPALLERLLEIADADEGAEFTLIVPMTQVSNLLTWTEGESHANAERAAETARQMMEAQLLNVAEARVGDESPLQAAEDAMATDGPFEAIIVSTLPPGMSRWLKLDVHNRLRQRYDIPVISVVTARETAAAR